MSSVRSSARYLSLGLLSLALWGCSEEQSVEAAPENEPEAIAVDTVTVEAQEVADAIEALGDFQAVDGVTVAAEVGARVQAIKFREGARVPAHSEESPSILFVLDPEMFDNAVEQAEAGLMAAARQVESARVGRNNAQLQVEAAGLQVQAAEKGLRMAEATLKQRQRDLEREQQLQAGNASTAKTLENVEYQVTLAEIGVEQARTGVEQARVGHKQAQAGLEAADAALAQAEAAQAQARVGLKQARLTRRKADIEAPPFAGIAGESMVSVGDLVAPGMPLVEIVSVDPIEAVFNVPERHRARLALGQQVTVHSEAYPEREFTGTVTFIAPRASESTRMLRVKADVGNADGALKPGMFARVSLATGSAAPRPVIPEQAVIARRLLKTIDGERRMVLTFLVYVVEDGRAVRKEIDVLRRLPGRVVVESGLEAGEELVVAGMQKIMDGSDVKVRSGRIDAPADGSGPRGEAPDADDTQ